MSINLSFLSQTLSPISKGSAAQCAAAVPCLRHFWETQPIQCHLSPSFLGSGEGVAYYFTVYASWNDSLIRQGGYFLWYCLCLWPLPLIVVHMASFLWRFSKHLEPQSYWDCVVSFGWVLVFYFLFLSLSPYICKFPVNLTSMVLVFCWANVRRWQPMPHRHCWGGRIGFCSQFSEVLNYFDTVT